MAPLLCIQISFLWCPRPYSHHRISTALIGRSADHSAYVNVNFLEQHLPAQKPKQTFLHPNPVASGAFSTTHSLPKLGGCLNTWQRSG